MLIDTHAHIHDKQYGLDPDKIIANAKRAGVDNIICVGTGASDSKAAVEFAQEHQECFATVGLHPHDAKLGPKELDALAKLVDQPKVVAVGECGLDYYYNHSEKKSQETALRFQIELAQAHDLPLVFHVRDAFDDFWKVLNDYSKARGVIHSFTSTKANLEEAIKRGLYVAFNGIMTFTKDEKQLEAVKLAPPGRIVIETDSPFLAPVPYRGKPNEPAYVKLVAEFLTNLRGEAFEDFATTTSLNAKQLFKISNNE